MIKAFTRHDYPTKAYVAWLDTLEHDVIENDFGYEPGEFFVDANAWWLLGAWGFVA